MNWPDDKSVLTADELTKYSRDGYLVIDRLIGSSDIENLRLAYEELIQRRVLADGDRMLGGITRQVMYPSRVHSTFEANPALDIARNLSSQILGNGVHFIFDMLIYKPPGHPHETPWHQDMSYAEMPHARPGLRIPLQKIQFWIALDDVDEENGCMHFAPGYHCKPLLEHTVAAGEPDDPGRLLALVDPAQQIDLAKSVACPLRAGGATIHSYGTPHYTPPNRSLNRPRRAYIFTFERIQQYPVLEKSRP